MRALVGELHALIHTLAPHINYIFPQCVVAMLIGWIVNTRQQSVFFLSFFLSNRLFFLFLFRLLSHLCQPFFRSILDRYLFNFHKQNTTNINCTVLLPFFFSVGCVWVCVMCTPCNTFCPSQNLVASLVAVICWYTRDNIQCTTRFENGEQNEKKFGGDDGNGGSADVILLLVAVDFFLYFILFCCHK